MAVTNLIAIAFLVKRPEEVLGHIIADGYAHSATDIT